MTQLPVKKSYDTLGPRRPLGVFSRFFDDFLDLDGPYDWFKDNYNIWSETENSYVTEVDLPGIKKGDVKVNVNVNLIEISAKSKRNGRESSYYNKFTVPGAADLDKIASKLEDGVLTITLPKSEKAKGREVKVE